MLQANRSGTLSTIKCFDKYQEATIATFQQVVQWIQSIPFHPVSDNTAPTATEDHDLIDCLNAVKRDTPSPPHVHMVGCFCFCLLVLF